MPRRGAPDYSQPPVFGCTVFGRRFRDWQRGLHRAVGLVILIGAACGRGLVRIVSAPRASALFSPVRLLRPLLAIMWSRVSRLSLVLEINNRDEIKLKL